MTRRRAFAFFGGVWGSILLSGCSGRLPTVADRTESPVPNTPQDAKLPTDLPQEEERQLTPLPQQETRPYAGVEIDFLFNYQSIASEGAVRAEIAKFASLTGISVNPDFSHWITYWDRQSARDRQRRKSGDSLWSATPIWPDIWQGGGLWIPVYAASHRILELDEYVASWDEWEDFYPDVRGDVNYDGHVFGVPYSTIYRGSVGIRPSLFEAAGLAPEPPSTWDELNEIAPRLTIRDGEVFEQAGFDLQHHTQVYEDWLIQAGGKVFDSELTKPLNDTPEGHIALAQHVRHGLLDETRPKEGMDSDTPYLHAFCGGKTAIQMLWPGNIANCESLAPDVFSDFAVGPPLKGPRQRAMQIFLRTYIPYKLTKQPDAVFETLKYFASPGPSYEIDVGFNRSMPCRAAMEEYELYDKEPYETLASNVKYARPRQKLPEHFEIQPAMSRWVEKAALGELGVSETLQGMDEEVQKLIDRRS